MRGKMLLLAAVATAAALPSSSLAQSGFALKGHYIVNSSAAEEGQEGRYLPEADAFSLGAEFVLPFGLGVGASAYTAASDEAYSAREYTILAEANYFLRFPLFPVSPYAGVHAGLGVLSQDDIDDPELEIQDRERSQLGFQAGLRFQLTPELGLDAQWRRMSTSAEQDQDRRLERDQFLIGVTVF